MEEENKGTSAGTKDSALKFLKEKKIVVIAAVGIILLLIIIGLGISNMGKKQGNTVGNLNNYGFVVEDGSWVYYLRFDGDEDDPEGIYKVQKNGNKKERVTSDYGFYLNVDGGYLYYVDGEDFDIVKMKTNGKDKKTLIKDVDQVPMTVYNGWIYYSKNGNFYRVKTNGEDSEKISNRDIESYQIVGNQIYYIYYNNSRDYTLAKMKLDGTKPEKDKIETEAGVSFYVKGNTIYYIYENYSSRNYTYSYELYSIKTNGKDKKNIFEFEEELYGYGDYVNMTDDGIYYLAENEDGDDAIFFINYQGKGEKEIIVIDAYSSPINIVDKWIYYTDYDDDYDTYTYRIKTDGKDKKEL